MKSIKPGRGPSALSAIGSVAAVLFGIFWTISAIQMGAPFFFPIFGLVFVCFGAVQAFYHYKNASGENRYSLFDITDSKEEPDPVQSLRRTRQGEAEFDAAARNSGTYSFCPYCGLETGADHLYCRRCGRNL